MYVFTLTLPALTGEARNSLLHHKKIKAPLTVPYYHLLFAEVKLRKIIKYEYHILIIYA